MIEDGRVNLKLRDQTDSRSTALEWADWAGHEQVPLCLLLLSVSIPRHNKCRPLLCDPQVAKVLVEAIKERSAAVKSAGFGGVSAFGRMQMNVQMGAQIEEYAADLRRHNPQFFALRRKQQVFAYV